MIKYCKQYDQYSCGAVAALNTHKWKGHKTTYRDINRIRKEIKCRRPKGTKERILTQYFKKHFTVQKDWKPTLTKIENALNEQKIVVVLELQIIKKTKRREGHYYIVTSVTNGQEFKTINSGRVRTAVYNMTRNELRDSIRKRKDKEKYKYPVAWYIS